MAKSCLAGTQSDDNPQNAWRDLLPAERLFCKTKDSFRGKRGSLNRNGCKKAGEPAEGPCPPLCNQLKATTQPFSSHTQPQHCSCLSGQGCWEINPWKLPRSLSALTPREKEGERRWGLNEPQNSLITVSIFGDFGQVVTGSGELLEMPCAEHD